MGMFVLLLLAAPALAQNKGVPSKWFAASDDSACSGSGSHAHDSFTSEILLSQSGPSGVCIKFPTAKTTRLILNQDKNDSGNQAAICLKQEDGSFKLLTGDTEGCKDKCCFFVCKSCPAPEE